MNQFFVLRYCDAVEEERSTMVIQAAELDRFGWTTFDVIRYDTIEEINVDSKAEYSLI